MRTYTLLSAENQNPTENRGTKRAACQAIDDKTHAKMSRVSSKEHRNHYQKVLTPSVSKRNERERNRVKQVNIGFEKLRQHVPNVENNKKMSKVDTLRAAVEYISQLQTMLESSTPAAMPFEEDSWSLLESTKTLLNLNSNSEQVVDVMPSHSHSVGSSPSQGGYSTDGSSTSVVDSTSEQSTSLQLNEGLLDFNNWFQ